MKYFACTYTYGPDAELVAETRPKHREFIAQLLDDAHVVGSGPYLDGEGALIVIQLADEAALADAEALMDKDPYTEAGALAGREIREWNPVSRIFP